MLRPLSKQTTSWPSSRSCLMVVRPDGPAPTTQTFIVVLLACSHRGLVRFRRQVRRSRSGLPLGGRPRFPDTAAPTTWRGSCSLPRSSFETTEERRADQDLDRDAVGGGHCVDPR